MTRQGPLRLGVAAAQHAAPTGHLAGGGLGGWCVRVEALCASPPTHTVYPCPTTCCTPPDPQVIAIDEAQFFPDLVEFCQEAVDNDGKHVIVAGLSGGGKGREGRLPGVCMGREREEACG